jgi:FHA domain
MTARLVIQTRGVEAAPAELKPGVTRVGRAVDNDVVISHPSVSGYHCELELSSGCISVRDCNSTNGTLVDGKPVKDAKLEPGQQLKFGQVEAVIERVEAQIQIPGIEIEQVPETIPLTDGTLSCVNHADMRAYWRCQDCQKLYCTGCIHEVRMVGGRSHRLCPKCSHEVELIVWDDAKPKRNSIWARLKGTFARKERTTKIR